MNKSLLLLSLLACTYAYSQTDELFEPDSETIQNPLEVKEATPVTEVAPAMMEPETETAETTEEPAADPTATETAVTETTPDPASAAPVEAVTTPVPESDTADADPAEAQPEAIADVPEEPTPEVIAPVSTPALVTTTEVDDDDKSFKPRQSHWLATFGFEGMDYDLPFEYAGEKEDFKAKKRSLWGGRIGFGGELHLGAGIMTTSRIEGYYMGTLFEKAKRADMSENIDIAATKDAGQIYGADLVQALSFQFELITKNPFMDEMTYLVVEPFVEAGIGRARAFNKKDYYYDSAGVIQEEYDHTIADDINTTRIGGGINLTSRSGYYLYLKATQYTYDITERKEKGYQYPNGGTPVSLDRTSKDVDMDPVMVYSMGGGFKF